MPEDFGWRSDIKSFSGSESLAHCSSRSSLNSPTYGIRALVRLVGKKIGNPFKFCN